MSVPAFCPQCGDTVGVVSGSFMAETARAYIGKSAFTKPDVGGYFDIMDSVTGLNGELDPNASCRGTHGEPVKRTLKRKFFNLIKVEEVSYPQGNGSHESWEEYDGPSSGLRFLMLLLYVKILKNDVFMTNGKDWVWPFLGIEKIRARA